ncbi:MAG: prepilin-type N-terminal cleavage/methylation domain-containing protein [Candidatus Gracilibacteria bacterium]|nr:prepilin-type N-terminal cleavage/methylation domain-containing protein [Candidatus Gracilibacteria bacterium]MDD2908221.1 prepilin-type N-terminal cleavage/methylation domain-containing protein [Candidatus Gracilibacteria bacterium]
MKTPNKQYSVPFIKGEQKGIKTIKTKQAFTLVELIVVIVILAILSTIAFLSFSSQSSSARDSSRLVDISSMKGGLELYQVNSGYYPLPENITGTGYVNSVELSYVGSIKDSISRLIKINKTPVDPLGSNNYYMYGVSYDKRFYQIGSILENPITFNNNLFTPFVYAANSYTSKVSGNYSGILKKDKTIYNLPSLLFSNSGTIDLTQSTTYFIADKSHNLPYKSDVSDLINIQIPSEILELLGNTSTSITGITIPDATYWNSNSGTITISIGYPIDIIGVTFFGSTKYFNEVKDKNIIVLDVNKKTVADCTTSKNIIYGTTTGTDTGLTCNDDIILCNGITGSGHIIASCNVGATVVYNNQTFISMDEVRNSDINSWAGGLYQRGRNDDISQGISFRVPFESSVPEDGYLGDSNYYYGTDDSLGSWLIPQDSDLWSGIKNQGPCNSGYHIPSFDEWTTIISNGQWCVGEYCGYDEEVDEDSEKDLGLSMHNILKLPFSGYRGWNGVGSLYDEQGIGGTYWSSTPLDDYPDSYAFAVYENEVRPDASNTRNFGYSIRCIK